MSSTCCKFKMVVILLLLPVLIKIIKFRTTKLKKITMYYIFWAQISFFSINLFDFHLLTKNGYVWNNNTQLVFFFIFNFIKKNSINLKTTTKGLASVNIAKDKCLKTLYCMVEEKSKLSKILGSDSVRAVKHSAPKAICVQWAKGMLLFSSGEQVRVNIDHWLNYLNKMCQTLCQYSFEGRRWFVCAHF